MKTFNLVVATPDSLIFSGEVVRAIFPGKEGRFEVLVDHAPIIALIIQGTLELVDDQHEVRHFQVSEGLFECYHNQASLLVH